MPPAGGPGGGFGTWRPAEDLPDAADAAARRSRRLDAASAKPLTVSGPQITFRALRHPAHRALLHPKPHRPAGQARRRRRRGLVLDPSPTRPSPHLDKVGEPLIKAFGNRPRPTPSSPTRWRPSAPTGPPSCPSRVPEASRLRPDPHLPELVAGGSARRHRPPRLRQDPDRTGRRELPEADCRLGCIAHHTKFRSQTYHEPAVSFSSQNIPQLAEGEGPQWRAFSTLRWATSANHVFGHDVSSGETLPGCTRRSSAPLRWT
jgi:hypothetical protein